MPPPASLPVISGLPRCTIRDLAAFLRDLRAVAADHDTHIICFNADMIAGRVHALSAVARAVRAFEEGDTISNTLEMESLLFAAGSRQCNIAASFGIHEGENRVYICCFPERAECLGCTRTVVPVCTGEMGYYRS